MLNKKSWIGLGSAGAAAVALLVGMLSVGCGNDKPTGPTTPANANGTWVATLDDGILSFTIKDGTFEMLMDGSPIGKGNCSASGSAFEWTATQVHGYFFGGIIEQKWYTKSELKAAINAITPITDAQFETQFGDVFKKQTGSFNLNGNTLTITFKGETQVFTKLQK
jgi:hypothetical protein